MINLMEPSLWRTQAFINGVWCNARAQKTFAVENPATGEIIAQVADVGVAETREAITAAAQAQLDWAQKTAAERSQLLRSWFNLVMHHQEDLAQILTLEQGKPLAEARGEIAYGASYIEWFAEEAKRIYGDVIAPPSADQRILVIKQPVGVVAAITPWNFPCAMLARKIAPALAAGCTIVAKPAAETPLSALALAFLAQQAGIPAGVINVVTGTDSAAIGAELTENTLVRKLSFTGSTAVGKQLIQQCAADVKRITLELGGNAPFIVFDDADLDAAVAGAMASKFRNAGQTCVCANRFYVHRPVYALFSEKLTLMMQSLLVGNGAEANTTIGPLISLKAIKKVQALVDDAIAQGARIAYQTKLEITQQGYFYPPTLLLDVAADSALTQQEIFGPVAALIPFDTEEDAIQLANNTEVGLAAYCYTRDAKRIKNLSDKLETGMVGINTGLISNAMAPFGGIKQSGWGREGSHYGIDDYVNIKYLCERF
ncbi:NAD-dependent succinate-semialdehyde dehydrogenase [Cellvibrio sp. OA-2007]|uniref:NAD-dependent succinate-semialdehyde dehydrogenase n=1 Tax=Cellvibrio sp. OA-2007 TaxID=529823 RepID=UPI0007865D00|nr:NAD-dependent succinate-semialdehyde dehydrogenase [Cellvibrio sp. OA-2007]